MPVSTDRAILFCALDRRGRPPGFGGGISGIDELACISIDDCFVMKAFGEALKADGEIEMLADASDFGLGTRSERHAMVVDDGTVESLGVEDNFRRHKVSSADEMPKAMRPN